MHFFRYLITFILLICCTIGTSRFANGQPEIKIFIACHKPTFLWVSDILTPIHVGKSVSGIDFGIQGYDRGDNISIKNPYYSELTATYWIWKNVKADIVGLYHYRRFFNLTNDNLNMDIHDKDFIDKTGNNAETIRKLMEEYDVILPQKLHFGVSTYDQYIASHPKEGIDTALEVIKEKYPEQFDVAYQTLHKEGSYYKNMLIAKRKVFDDYAKWLFDILFEVEKRVHSVLQEKQAPLDQRHYGFLGERMMEIYINLHPNLKVKEVPVWAGKKI